jgi:hypothetical protein
MVYEFGKVLINFIEPRQLQPNPAAAKWIEEDPENA